MRNLKLDLWLFYEMTNDGLASQSMVNGYMAIYSSKDESTISPCNQFHSLFDIGNTSSRHFWPLT